MRYPVHGDAQNLQLINGRFTTIFVHFFANNKKIVSKTEVSTVPSYDVKHFFFHFTSFWKLTKLTKTGESLKSFCQKIHNKVKMTMSIW